MKRITKKNFLENETFYLDEIKKGKIFIYPTDTIYGIGCDASNGKSIEKIREIKKRDSKPMSIIVPSIRWIEENCFIDNGNEFSKLPGPYTFIVNLKNEKIISKKELIGELKGIGIRIPNNWFTKWIEKNDLTFVTTSVNLSGENHLINPSQLKEEIELKVDYFIEDGILSGKPSTVIDLRNGEILRK